MAEFSDARSGAYCTCTRERCSDECRTYRQFHPKPITNADRIRSMTDEELAEFIANAVDCCNCKHPRNGCSENDETCAACWLDWLKQEVDDGNNVQPV